MTIRLTILLFFLGLSGCSSMQLNPVGNLIVGNVVSFATDALVDSDADAWVPAYQRCDSACEARRQVASAQLAAEHNRRAQRERKEQTVEAFDEYMDELESARYAPASYSSVILVD